MIYVLNVVAVLAEAHALAFVMAEVPALVVTSTRCMNSKSDYINALFQLLLIARVGLTELNLNGSTSVD